MSRQSGGRVLALVTDAYGGLGGIAAYNRDVFQALSDDARIAETVVVPRVKTFEPAGMPPRVVQRNEAIGSTAAWLGAVVSEVRRGGIGLVHCAHANLAPVAMAAAFAARVPWTLSLYGIEVWERHSNPLTNSAIARATLNLPISHVTETRFRAAFPTARGAFAMAPNALHRAQFRTGPRSRELAARYGLGDAPVVMSMARLGVDYQLKGFERIIGLLPRLMESSPGLRYLVCGDGPARAPLTQLAAKLGVADRVIFTGYVDEAEKADHYRLADAFVLPSMGEGFGFVLTEAMACGVPVVASSRDGGLDATRGGTLGRAVDPLDEEALLAAIEAALGTPKRVPDGLDFFDYPHFRDRLHAALSPLLAG